MVLTPWEPATFMPLAWREESRFGGSESSLFQLWLRFVQPALVLTFTFTNATIARLEVIGDRSRLRELDIRVL